MTKQSEQTECAMQLLCYAAAFDGLPTASSLSCVHFRQAQACPEAQDSQFCFQHTASCVEEVGYVQHCSTLDP